MDKIKSFSVCDIENDGFWCDIEWREALRGGERREGWAWGFSYWRSIGGGSASGYP
jgi:hypothetical protein